MEVLQRKFDEFQKDMAAQEFRVTEVLDLADRLVKDGHPEVDTINRRKEVIVGKFIGFHHLRLNHFCYFIGIERIVATIETLGIESSRKTVWSSRNSALQS